MNNLVGKNLTAGYGGVDIIKDINVEVNEGEIVVIVGPNGAGKSTAMKALLGMLSLTSGSVEYSKKEISSMLPQNRINLGLAFVPQTNNVFTGMTVEENLEMGGFLRDDDIIHTINDIYDLFPILKEKRNQSAGELSGGQRQQVAFGRALMTKPNILMLDEPTAGVSPIAMDELFSAKKLIERCQQEVASEGFSVHSPPVGVMIEVPAAVYLAETLAKEVDFLSVGSNDLTQYLLAVDRGNARVAPLYQSLHPAVLSAFRHVLDAAKNLGKPVSICGELAGDARAAPLLIGMGFDQLSMNAGSLPVVKHILAAFSRKELKVLLDHLMTLNSSREIEETIDVEFSQRGLEPFLHKEGGS